MKPSCVCLFVPAVDSSRFAAVAAAGLLLWAQWAGDTNQLLQDAFAAGAAAFPSTYAAARRSAVNKSSVVFTAAKEG